MIRLVAKLSDRLLNSLVPAEDALACEVTRYKVPCTRLRTGRCEKYCYRDCNGVVTCEDDADCVC